MSTQNSATFVRTVKPVVENLMDDLLWLGLKLFIACIVVITVLNFFKRKK